LYANLKTLGVYTACTPVTEERILIIASSTINTLDIILLLNYALLTSHTHAFKPEKQPQQASLPHYTFTVYRLCRIKIIYFLIFPNYFPIKFYSNFAMLHRGTNKF